MFFCCKFLNGFYLVVLKLIWLWVTHLISCSPDVIAISIVITTGLQSPSWHLLTVWVTVGWAERVLADPASRKQEQWRMNLTGQGTWMWQPWSSILNQCLAHSRCSGDAALICIESWYPLEMRTRNQKRSVIPKFKNSWSCHNVSFLDT